jgi:hypothetical protein
MHYTTLRKMIQNSSPADWLNNDQIGVWTLISDVAVNLVEMRDEEETEARAYKAPWALNFPDENAMRTEMELRYSGSFVERYTVVVVDGGRHRILQPNADGGLDAYGYNLGRILNRGERDYEDAVKRAGLKVTT